MLRIHLLIVKGRKLEDTKTLENLYEGEERYEPIIKDIAEQITFQFINKLLDLLFKNRFGIVHRAVGGESVNVQHEPTDAWKLLLPNVLSEYQPSDIFTVDEFGLFFNLLPNTIFAFKRETCHGGKQSKEWLTVLVGANIDGSEKLQLLIIGKA
ncbi:hypothetical protein PR048_008200 [Dryococelus australis]|uniref:Uncharacterized protein n=1 Tax=Dryococelus australis TaxID=614101 RepID=A0ABQ9HWF5_9NEOP|nr:hypothetical protein PR048_008200 [Dryococelus australis]